jgi:type II secretory ATPase GspE/PulE/Tfp pilus assembly ATPase PilB-like protein
MQDDLVRLVRERIRQHWLAFVSQHEMSPARQTRPEPPAEMLLDKWQLVALPADEALAQSASRFDPKIARTYRVFPIDLASEPKKLLAEYPTMTDDPRVLDELSRLAGGRVNLVIADRDLRRNKEILQRLLRQHFPAPAELSLDSPCPLEGEPARAFLEWEGTVLGESEPPPLVHLFGLVTSEALRSGTTQIQVGPAEDRLEIVFTWGSERGLIQSPPGRLRWLLAFTIMAALDMDVRAVSQPQTAQTEVRVKNGTVRIEATAEPTPLSPRFTLTLHRQFSAT